MDLMTSPVIPSTYTEYSKSTRQTNATDPAVEPYLTTAEAAAYLHLHPKTLRRKCLAGEVRYERIGSRWLRFKRRWLDDLAERWRQ
jgi:excisionase family DNA binding protein